MRREGLFREFVSFIKDSTGNPIYENTMQYAILKKEWDVKHPSPDECFSISTYKQQKCPARELTSAGFAVCKKGNPSCKKGK